MSNNHPERKEERSNTRKKKCCAGQKEGHLQIKTMDDQHLVKSEKSFANQEQLQHDSLFQIVGQAP